MSLLLGVFAGVLLPCFAVFYRMLHAPAADKKIQRRVTRIPKARKEAAADNDGLVREEEEGVIHLLGEHLKRFHFAADLERLILHAASDTTVGSVVVTSIALALGSGIVAHLFLQSIPLTAAATLLGGSSRYMLLKLARSKRLKQFEAALPDAIDLMARALRAGHSTGSSIEVVSEQSPEPLKSEFALCFQQQKFGVPFREALLAMGDRVPSKDLSFLITAVLVQKETGGDLTEILDRTSRVIRDRMRIQGEVKTYTAQGRLTGWILGLMPIIMLGLINLLSPGYSAVLFTDPLGQKMLYAGGIFILIGGFIIRKIVDIKV